jgi:hypothetical protein
MSNRFRARWASKGRGDALRKRGEGILVEGFKGYIVIEPVGSRLGDGQVLSHQEADYELRSPWCQAARTRLSDARQRLGLPKETSPQTPVLIG